MLKNQEVRVQNNGLSEVEAHCYQKNKEWKFYKI